ncbi:MAG TPA: hypothetical protein VIY73_05000, partial [Polyangiaceae bacterium]
SPASLPGPPDCAGADDELHALANATAPRVAAKKTDVATRMDFDFTSMAARGARETYRGCAAPGNRMRHRNSPRLTSLRSAYESVQAG